MERRCASRVGERWGVSGDRRGAKEVIDLEQCKKGDRSHLSEDIKGVKEDRFATRAEPQGEEWMYSNGS